MLQNREKSLVFVVDDEEVIASTVADILRLNDLDAIPFSRSTEALERSRSVSPDLLISDVMMPGISGAELAQHVQWSHPKCRVLLLSGQWDRADAVVAAYEDGLVYQLIRKPVHPKELLRKVCEMLDITPKGATTGEERAHLRTVDNRKESIAAVRADLAISTARRQSAGRRSDHDRQN